MLTSSVVPLGAAPDPPAPPPGCCDAESEPPVETFAT